MVKLLEKGQRVRVKPKGVILSETRGGQTGVVMDSQRPEPHWEFSQFDRVYLVRFDTNKNDVDEQWCNDYELEVVDG